MNSKSKFKAGDRVRIAKSSEYYGDSSCYNPKDIIGTVNSYRKGRIEAFTTKVDWDNGTNNSYRDADLELVVTEPKELTVDKDFVMQAYESACSDWKKRIEQKFPDLFPKEKFAKLITNAPDGSYLYYKPIDGHYKTLEYSIALIDGVAGRDGIPAEAKHRGIYVHDGNKNLELEVVKATDGHVILFKNKS